MMSDILANARHERKANRKIKCLLTSRHLMEIIDSHLTPRSPFRNISVINIRIKTAFATADNVY